MVLLDVNASGGTAHATGNRIIHRSCKVLIPLQMYLMLMVALLPVQ